MKISQMSLKSSLSGLESLPIFDPNEPLVQNRNKRVLASLLAGSDGAQGPAGKSAYQSWLDQGNTGTEADFVAAMKGDPGESAYQTWLDLGNVGNEQEFLDSQKGPPGDSNYQIWLDAGNTGTEQDFLDSIKGDHGTTWYLASGVPSNSLGIDGDFYINSDNSNVYQKVAGDWGSALYSMEGSPGSKWNSDMGPPNPSTGVDSDFYLDQSNGDVYGPKLFGDWGSPVMNLTGPQGPIGPTGPRGALLLSGSVAPTPSDGLDDDHYINVETGEFYGPKTTGDWGSPIAIFTTPSTDLILKNPDASQQLIRSIGDGLIFDGAGDVTLTFDNTLGILTIDATGDWNTLQNKPTTRDTFGLTDVYTESETDAAISAAISAIGSVYHYVGQWNASTNTPTLSNADAATDPGAVYRVSVAGTQDLGSGPIDFKVNDRLVSNGTTWDKWDVTDETLTSDEIIEGTTNLFFTDERAQDAVGQILTNSSEINLTYDDAGNAILASLVDGGVGNNKLANSSISIAGTDIVLGGSIDRDQITGVTDDGLIKRSGADTLVVAVQGTDYAAPTNGTDGQALTSDGAGGFGTPVTLGTAATADAGDFAPASTLSDAQAFASGLIVTTITSGDTTHAPSGDTVFQALETKASATTGTNILKGDGAGGTEDAVAGTDYADPTVGTAGFIQTTDGAGKHGVPIDPSSFSATITVPGTAGQFLTTDGSGDFGTSVTLGSAALADTGDFDPAGAAAAIVTGTIAAGDTTHAPSSDSVYTALATKAPSTSGTSILKGNGSGGFDNAEAGSDYAEATNGTNGQILTSDGAGGFGAPIDPGSIGFTPGTAGQFLTANGSGGFGSSVTLGSAALEDTTAFDAAGAAATAQSNAEAYADGKIVTLITDGDTTHAPSSDTVYDVLGTKLDTSEVGISVAPLVGGVVPSIHLPSYVDDVVEYANFAALPGTGETGKIYVTTDDNKQYRWSGSVYVQLVASPGSTDAVPEGTTNLYFTNFRAQAAAGNVNGILKGNGSGTLSAAVSGTDYAPPTSGTAGYLTTVGTSGGFGTPIDPAVIKKTCIPIAVSDEITPITAGTNKVKIRMPYAFTLTKVKGSLTTAQASGSVFTVDIKRNGTSIFSTTLTFDNTEDTTATASTPAVLTSSTIACADDDVITIDVSQIGDGTATGLKIYLIGYAT